MKRGTKIAIAVAACFAIWFVFAIINAVAGNSHGGGIFVMTIMFGIIAFVWRKIVGKKDGNEATTLELHNGTGENRYDFEVQLTQDEILQMSKIREKEPDRWIDNEYELVKTIKPDFRIDELENSWKKQQTETEEAIKTIKLLQDGIEVSMSLTSDVIKQMEVLRKQDPEKWNNKEVELVREAKKQTKSNSIERNLESEKLAEKSETEDESVEIELHKEEISTPCQETVASAVSINEETKSSGSLFGNKLESEFRRESKSESHWIRQDDTDICINIEQPVYKLMVELQNENPKRWVNKELDLYKKAKSMLLEKGSSKRSLFKRNK